MTTTTDMPTSQLARKVQGATIGAGAGGVVSGLVLWLLDDYAFDPSTAGSVPEPLVAAVLFFVPALLTLAGGYFTKRGLEETLPVEDVLVLTTAATPPPANYDDGADEEDDPAGDAEDAEMLGLDPDLDEDDYGFEDGPDAPDDERRIVIRDLDESNAAADPVDEPQDADHEDAPRE